MSLFCQLVFQVGKLEALHTVGMQRVLWKRWKDSGTEVEEPHLIQAEQGSGRRFLQPDLIGICALSDLEIQGLLVVFVVVLSRTYECFSTNLLNIFMWKVLVLTKIVLILQLEIQIVIIMISGRVPPHHVQNITAS